MFLGLSNITTFNGGEALTRKYIGPPVELIVYRNDVVLRHAGAGGNGAGGSKRPQKQWSNKSRKNLAFVASNTTIELDVMVTLTYPREFPANGKTCKRHLNAFLQFLRRRIRPLSYLWFFEFQRRGAPHFHLLYRSGGVTIDKLDVSERWYSIVGSGDVRHLSAGTRIETIRCRDGARRYAVKYAAKMRQKIVPDGFRSVGSFWACSRDVRPKPITKITLNFGTSQVRRMLKDWPYLEKCDVGSLSVLYGAAGCLELDSGDGYG